MTLLLFFFIHQWASPLTNTSRALETLGPVSLPFTAPNHGDCLVHASRREVRETATPVAKISRHVTKPEKENAQLREQLKFQVC